MTSVENTSRRLTVQVLLRGLIHGLQAQVSVGGYTIFITGAASAASWPHVVLQPNDLEGVLWTSTASLEEVVKALRQSELVLAIAGV